MNRIKLTCLTAVLCLSTIAFGQIRNNDVYEVTESHKEGIRNEFRIPDVGKYKVLKSDLHTHTVFSDGEVWPSFRVKEAWQEGLDVIAITDHIEYRPHKDIVKGDHNEPYKIAARQAASMNILVIPGTEITRSKPFGHINALFVKDANLIAVPDGVEAVNQALLQGAFIQWNHPGWPDDLSTLYPVHEELLSQGKIHAVELVNDKEYYPLVFDWFQKYNLAPTANSDIHGTVAFEYSGRRPITLILAEENSLDGVKEALFARRTIALFDDMLIGTPDLLTALIKACIEIGFAPDGTIFVTNKSDLNFRATYEGMLFILPAAKSLRLGKMGKDLGVIQFENCFIGHNQKLQIEANSF